VFLESFRLELIAYGIEHPEVAATLHSMGNLYQHQCQYRRALDEYRESWRILLAAYGKEHPEVAVALHNMSCVEL
jgi:nephrocystin-3